MNIQRLKFAWARGARMQQIWGDGRWSDVGATMWVRILDLGLKTKIRIHPDDAHLEYGPLSSALREAALSLELYHSPMLNAAIQLIEDDLAIVFDATDDFECDCLALMYAEHLADEGL